MPRRSVWWAILVGGSIAGTLDITYAIVVWALRARAPAVRVLQSVASGLLGASAFKGGLPVAALGLFLHFCIAFSWAAAFCFAGRRVAWLTRHVVVSGLLYGAVIFSVMNFIVLPLSAVPRKSPPHLSVAMATELVAHMFFIGLPIALTARQALKSAVSGLR